MKFKTMKGQHFIITKMAKIKKFDNSQIVSWQGCGASGATIKLV